MGNFVPLIFLSEGSRGVVESLDGGKIFSKKLMEMGLNKGSEFQIIKNDIGPVILRYGETRLVISKGMAQKVMVREV